MSQLPLDGEFAFLQLDSKCLHLGYPIYIPSFQHGDVASALPLVSTMIEA